jgi:hypothetical protein
VHELGHDQPKTTKEFLDISTRHASGEEAVGAIFMQSTGKAALGDGRGAPTKATDRDAKSGTRSDKRGPKWWPQGVTITTSYDEGDNDNDASDSNEDHFKKLLKATCPNHMYPGRHKLKEGTMMENYMTTGTFARGKKLKGDPTRKVVVPFSKEKAVMSIYGGSTPHKT